MAIDELEGANGREKTAEVIALQIYEGKSEQRRGIKR